MNKKIIVSGAGCCLVDLLYNDIDFKSQHMEPFLSKKRGDGGLAPGNLVFTEEFERFAGIPVTQALEKITGGRKHDKINIGGPSIVSLINITQLVDKNQCEVRYFGLGGNDEMGRFIIEALGRTKVQLRNYRLIDHSTPSTLVLSDPLFEDGHGERMFINSIGAAWMFDQDDLDEDFFNSDIVVFGGTALVPRLHDDLTVLLEKAKRNGGITIVNTVFDFRSEKADPSGRWLLGKDDDSYRFIDLLITDREEALRLSGESTIEGAVEFFINRKVSSFLITNGSKNISVFSDGRFFSQTGKNELPASARVMNELVSFEGGDTTGCGDNFAGGVIASIVNQMNNSSLHPDMTEACCWGIVSGGFTCFYVGGTYFEDREGEKLSRIKPYYDSYREQISGG
jgi:sugar/nucleoside kinase (ribokinase family)